MKAILLSILVLGVLGGLFGALLAYASKFEKTFNVIEP